MSVLEAQALSCPVQPFVTTCAVSSGILAPAFDQALIEGWNRLFNAMFEWGADPAQFADEDIEPPSPAAISAAAKMAQWWHDHGYPAPTIAAPDGEGGISFEFRRGTRTELVVVHPDNTSEIICFENHRIVERSPICAG
ncbi:MAG: hypothetical protein NTW87_05735 [Planctomycetota bacterium]|nr:hypothetical protein [Planctomycetota bacterium]